MIEERSHGKPLHHIRHAAHVIRMVMRDQQVIDLLDARRPDRLHDASRITRTGIAGIDQHGLPAWRDE